MTDNVVHGSFQKKREEMPVFEHHCSNQLFYLNVDGTIECRMCGELIDASWEHSSLDMEE